MVPMSSKIITVYLAYDFLKCQEALKIQYSFSIIIFPWKKKNTLERNAYPQ